MQIIDWPAGVPSCIMPTSPQGGLRDNRYSFETDSQFPPIERPAGSWAPEVYSVELAPLSLEQFAEFQAWYRDALRYGVLPFVAQHPVLRVPGVWKIVKADPPYQVRKAGRIPDGSGKRRVSVAFTVMSLPGSAPDWWSDYRVGGDDARMVADFARGRYGFGPAPFVTGLSSLFSFSRGSIGTYIGQDGLIHTAAAGEMRTQYRDGAAEGVLIEGSSVNRQTRSDISTGWTVWDGGSDSALTPGAARAPDGTMSAATFLCTTTGFLLRRVLGPTMSLTSGISYATSLHVRPVNNWPWVTIVLSPSAAWWTYVAAARFNMLTGEMAATTGHTPGFRRLEDGSIRISVVGTAATTANHIVSVVLHDAPELPGDWSVGIPGAGIEMWGAQVEPDAVTSYIPTGATSESRAADVIGLRPGLGPASVAAIYGDGTQQSLPGQVLDPGWWLSPQSRPVVSRIVGVAA